jgi:hypothetical protein
MLLRELFDQTTNEKIVWGRTGKSVVRKYRCSGGTRHGRVVSKMAQCFSPLNFRQSARFKRTKARFGDRMIRRSNITKRVNPASRRVQALNK